MFLSSLISSSIFSATELDCCVIPVRNNLKLIQTTDFFYANVDDPYTVVCLFNVSLLQFDLVHLKKRGSTRMSAVKNYGFKLKMPLKSMINITD